MKILKILRNENRVKVIFSNNKNSNGPNRGNKKRNKNFYELFIQL